MEFAEPSLMSEFKYNTCYCSTGFFACYVECSPNSNTTLVNVQLKIKFPVCLPPCIQIQHLLLFNSGISCVIPASAIIQIQHLLLFNRMEVNELWQRKQIQIQHLLLFNGFLRLIIRTRTRIQIQHLLLFNILKYEIWKRHFHSNTTHVTVQLSRTFLNLTQPPNSNTTLVTVQRWVPAGSGMPYPIQIQHLLLFNPTSGRQKRMCFIDSNTTLVTVQPECRRYSWHYCQFKYNTCYCSTQVPELHTLKNGRFKYNTCYCSTAWCTPTWEAIGHSNTTLVTVQHASFCRLTAA